jgi:F-type H+-transporting ATPase subunit delta
MNNNRISVRYAKALFQTALEKNIAEKIKSDMLLLIASSKILEFKHFLENPVIFPSKKQELFNHVFKDKVNDLTLDFFKLLTKNKRELFLSTIAINYKDLADKHFGIKAVELITAFKAEEKLLSDVSAIMSKIFKAKIEINKKTDPDIIGGFVLTVEGVQYDASVSHKLNNVKKDLLGSH